MRSIKTITSEEENFRVEGGFIKRDPVEPEPVGTLIMIPFRITGYDPDCDGSLMARLEAIDVKGEATGWNTDSHGLYPDTGFVITQEELTELFEKQ